MQAKEQKNESTKNANLQNQTQFGVAKPHNHDPNEEVGHENG